MLNINIEQLSELLKDFYTLAKIRIVIIDDEYQEVLSYPEKHCAFCKLMNDNPETREKCTQSNSRSFELCKKTGQLKIYTCHAGLIEATAPIKDNGVIIGYIMFGQILNVENHQETKKLILEHFVRNDIDLKVLEEAVGKIKAKSLEQIKSSAKILEACTSYLLLNEIVSLQKENFLAVLDQYIDEHINENIEIGELCRLFHIGRTKLYSTASSYLGCGIAEHIKFKRMKAAKRLLKSTELSITKISSKIGFQDYNYFCRVFKKDAGISAKAYRKQNNPPNPDITLKQ